MKRQRRWSFHHQVKLHLRTLNRGGPSVTGYTCPNTFLPVLQSSPVCCPRTWHRRTSSRSDTSSPSLPPPGSASTIWKPVSENRSTRTQKRRTGPSTRKSCGRWSTTHVCDGHGPQMQGAGWRGHVKETLNGRQVIANINQLVIGRSLKPRLQINATEFFWHSFCSNNSTDLCWRKIYFILNILQYWMINREK